MWRGFGFPMALTTPLDIAFLASGRKSASDSQPMEGAYTDLYSRSRERVSRFEILSVDSYFRRKFWGTSFH